MKCFLSNCCNNKRDNRTGTQGPPGVQCPQGERGLTGATGMTGAASTVPGPQGPPGPNQILPANLYYNTGNEFSIGGSITNIGTPGNSTATCQKGDIAIGGNFDVISYRITAGDPLANVVILYDGNEGFDKYSTDVELFGIQSQLNFTTNVLCFNNP